MAIILVLSAIVIPLSARFIGTAQSSRCVSNLRELAVYAHGQAAETGFYLPMLSHTTGANGSLQHTGDWLGRHINDKSSVICPAAKFTGYNDRGRPIGGYGANPRVMGWMTDGEPPLVRPTQISRPTEVMLMSDGAQFKSNPRPLQFNARWWGSRNGKPENAEKELTTTDIIPGGFWDEDVSTIPLRHHGKANILFCDGHVSSIRRIGELKEKNLYWNY
ncbi:MAG: hypothetical protein HKN82_08930 [Akkermansiaceae bacterium]|nr:hypothetical protein [Akkermansiaceae bacterium]